MDISQKISVPIDVTDADLKTFLSDLQGNILKGHGRDHTVNCFLRFEGAADKVGQGLAALVTDGHLTSAADQLAGTAALKAGGPRDVPVAFLFVTHSGYQKLGLTATQDLEEPFTAGMHKRTNLGDTPGDWEPTLKDDIDALLLVARDAPDGVDNSTGQAGAGAIAHADQLVAALAVAGIVEQHREIGRARRNAAGEGIEHFGYVDGRSQPLLLKSDSDAESKVQWNPDFSPSDTVLVADPNGAHSGESFGSYFVFRKLEQNVKAFKASEETLADALGLTDADRHLAGAMAVGRFKDGTPLTLSTTAQGGPVVNDFNFDKDMDANRCPFQAHIRKTNPRGDVRRRLNSGSDDGDRDPIMARRGITYGDRYDDPNDDDITTKPETGNGLLFMAYQRSLVDQFEFTQQSWANNPVFVNDLANGLALTGIDPVIGQAPGKPLVPYQWPNQIDTADRTPAPFAQHVKMLGGAYFFAPSISAIQSFGKLPAAVVAELAHAK